MNGEQYWVSRITPRPDLDYRQIVSLGALDPYGQHQAIWKLFNVAQGERTDRAAFLFRAEQRDGLPMFFVISRRQPQDHARQWRIETKQYCPDIQAGDRLAFKLRVNPVVHDKKERTSEEAKRWIARRRNEQRSEKPVTKKRIRHDAVMDAKTRMGWKDVPANRRPTLAYLACEAGACWLRDREERLGCQFDSKVLRVDGYRTWRLHSRKNIELATLDFEGMLTVTGQQRFLDAVLLGIGPAKAFGCGLLLVRRIA